MGTYAWTYAKTNFTVANIKSIFRSGGPVHKLGFQSIDCRKFSRPADNGEWQKRVWNNFSEFRTLYMLTTLLIAIWMVISNTWLMCGILIISVGWYFFDLLAKLACKMENPTFLQKVTIMAPLALVIALITGMISTVIEIFVFSIILSLTHASFHKGPVTVEPALGPGGIVMTEMDGDIDVSGLEAGTMVGDMEDDDMNDLDLGTDEEPNLG